MKKFASFAALAALSVFGVLFSAPVFADSPGQLAGGTNLYKVRNVTTNGSYSSAVAATCDQTVKYSVEVSNTQFGALSDVTVKANLASGDINVSANNSAGSVVTSNGNVQVSANGGTLNYLTGTTQLLTVTGQLIKTLADGVTTNGVNAGDLAGSTREFVQFQAKVSCPEQPKDIQVCELATKKIITIKETDFDASKHSKNLDDCKEVKTIQVCELATKKIVTIKESDYDASKHSKNLDDCKEVVKINVCELSTKKIITIDEKDFDSKKHSKNLSDCVVPGEIVVCEIATKSVVKIKENDFDDSKYTKDLSKCETVTPPVTELPHTGMTGNVIAVVASLATLAGGYVATRKNVLG